MTEYQVTCVTKPNRFSAHDHITHIGGNWTPRTLRVEAAIDLIDSRKAAFYTVEKTTGKRADIQVVRETGKHPYLRTVADGYYNDNLLALAECSIA